MLKLQIFVDNLGIQPNPYGINIRSLNDSTYTYTYGIDIYGGRPELFAGLSEKCYKILTNV